ncbi:MAG: hypothetical protein LAN71_03605 [Acidobacteriia bacterium]|nr:hypothetical protein [Terriglobia bacterium]
MLAENPEQKKSLLKNPALYAASAIVVAALYAGNIFYGRWQESREIEQRAAEKRRDLDAQIVESMGGKRLEIQSFYAAPGHIHRGDTSQLCYGVANAKKVTLDPPAGAVWPSLTRCLNVSPEKTTAYTLTIEDEKGNRKTETITLAVQ